MKKIYAADLFCGAGGTSSGLLAACRARGLEVELIAVNHWDVAIQTHSKNHPGVRNLCEDLDNVRPKELVPGGRLNLLCASPPCQHHSRARGGKPVNDQMRSSAWRILDWATDLYIDSILMENVREWEEWGPLGVDGRPLKSKKGRTFQAFMSGLRGLGYRVEYKILNAADYGDPTTRERLFVIARRGNKPIIWPEATHGPRSHGQMDLLDARKTWRAAREIIDWNIPGRSIYQRKKPLAPATLERIAAGLKKFGGRKAEPFLVILRNHMAARSIDEPVPTITAGGEHLGVCQPFVVEMRNGKTANSVEDPLSTVTTKGAHHALIEPFVLGQQSGSAPRSVDNPVPTVAGGGAIASVDDPLPAVTSHGAGALVEPFIIPQFSEGAPRSVDDPLGTVTTTSRGVGLVEPFLTGYYGNGDNSPVSEPVPTVTTKDRFALVEPDGVRFDIRFRMLQPHELALAQGFPADYKFEGNREQIVKQIGNAVPCGLAEALCGVLI